MNGLNNNWSPCRKLNSSNSYCFNSEAGKPMMKSDNDDERTACK